MVSKPSMNRRQAIKILAATGITSFSGILTADGQIPNIGAMIPGKGWVPASSKKGEHDGTPLQFMPKAPADPSPLENELEKYPRCPYCGMSRTKFNHSRHLVQYDDNLVDGCCSIHCLAISFSLNIDRGPKAIYAADAGADGKIKPLVEVDKATYLVGSKLKGTMTMNSKAAFSSADAANAAKEKNGGEIMDFDGALQQTYLDMGKDTIGIRKRRAEKRKMMMKKMKGKS